MTAAAILTGGRARRFQGRDKSRLVIDGRPILEAQLELVGPIVSEILVVTSEARAAAFGQGRLGGAARLVIDHYPGTGPLGAILTAIEAAGPGPASILILAADMPHVPRSLLEALVRLHAEPGDHDATVPESGQGLEPLCAIYARSAEAGLRGALGSGELSLQRALQALRLRIMTVAAVTALGNPARFFRNINRPDDI